MAKSAQKFFAELDQNWISAKLAQKFWAKFADRVYSVPNPTDSLTQANPNQTKLMVWVV